MHEYVIGKSGAGKSTYLENHALGNPGGFAFLDPHGDTGAKIADATRCIVLEPADPDYCFGLNVLNGVPPTQHALVASHVVSAFKAIWGESWGPRLEWILYATVRLILCGNGSLKDIPQTLTDMSFRARLIGRCRDPIIRNFWELQFEEWNDNFRQQATDPVLNKVQQLLANPLLRNILSHNTLRLPRLMDRGRRIVINLSKGQLGETSSHLLGALFVTAFSQAALARAVIRETDRTPFTLYVDEFQNFATESFADILSEARKYRLSLVLAHQYLGQLPVSLRQAVFGNVQYFVSFTVGAEDAPLLAKEYGFESPSAFTDLPPFKTWRKHGLHTFPEDTLPPQPGRGLLGANRKHTRACYTRRPWRLAR